MTPSVVKCPASTCRICSTVQLVSGTVYQLSAYQPIMNHTYRGPYNFCLYACKPRFQNSPLSVLKFVKIRDFSEREKIVNCELSKYG